MSPLLSVKNLQAHFEDTPILQGVDLEVSPGEVHVFLGPNGSGKSTFGRAMMGDPQYDTTVDELLFDGKDIHEMPTHERALLGLFLSFQNPPLIDGINTKNFLFSVANENREEQVSSFRFKKELEEMIEHMKLKPEFLVREFNKGASGGEKRKMELVTLDVLKPKLAFLDEIDSGVDVDSQRIIAEYLEEFMKDKSRSLIIVSHTETFLQSIQATHAHIFYHGKIVHSGSAPQIIGEVYEKGYGKILKELAVS